LQKKSLILLLRPALPADSEILLCWRNEPLAVRSSLDAREIPQEEHERWFSRALQREDLSLQIAEAEGEPVGSLRVQRGADGRLTLSWTVAPEWRGRGVGKEMLKLGIAGLRGQLLALIKDDNKASQAIASAAGFVLLESRDGVGLWELRK
jgi:RimJ/RimL family protein N-acetyltransferase